MEPDIKVLADADALSQAVATCWQHLSTQAIAARGTFHVALSGGNTPRYLYEVLARAPFARGINWAHTRIYFSDERCVAPDHPDSNYRMAHAALLSQVPLPPTQIHRIEGELPSAQAAARYADVLTAQVPMSADDWPCFDLMLLGIGDDGHTASLFPGTPILDVADTPVASVHVPRLDVWRVSLTLPVLNHARAVIVLAAGAGKCAILHQILETPPPHPLLPIQRVKPGNGVRWYLDTAAAASLQTIATGKDH